MYFTNADRSRFILDGPGKSPSTRLPGQRIWMGRVDVAEAEKTEHAVFTRELMINPYVERVLVILSHRVIAKLIGRAGDVSRSRKQSENILGRRI